MGSFKDLTGLRFGRLIVLARGENATNTYGKPIARWICACDCGAETLVRGSKLSGGITTSCGCFHREQLSKQVTTHGKRHTRAYQSWAHAKNRCTNPSNAKYPLYGARGINMCDRWLNSFEAFYDDMGDPPPGHTLDRFPDRDGPYEPGNCRWATPSQQANNLRTTHFFEWRGETKTLTEWAQKFGVTRDLIKLRLRKGHEFGAICEALSMR